MAAWNFGFKRNPDKDHIAEFGHDLGHAAGCHVMHQVNLARTSRRFATQQFSHRCVALTSAVGGFSGVLILSWAAWLDAGSCTAF